MPRSRSPRPFTPADLPGSLRHDPMPSAWGLPGEQLVPLDAVLREVGSRLDGVEAHHLLPAQR